MNFNLVVRVWGYLLILLAITLVIPTLLAVYFKEEVVGSFLATLFISLFIGLLMVLKKSDTSRFQIKESFLMVTGGWMCYALVGSLPYSISHLGLVAGPDVGWTDAVFETMSGLTTTGSSVFSDIEALPRSILFWRSFTHWLGGMGIVVLSLAIMPLLGHKGTNLYKAEVPGPNTDKLGPRLQATAKVLWAVYMLFTAVHAILLYIAGMGVLDSICHSFSTMATGGFSNHNASIAGYNNPMAEWIIIFFMIMAGANFSLHFRLLRGNVSSYFKDLEFKAFLIIIGMATLFVTLSLTRAGVESVEALRRAAFQVTSIITTTGYVSDNYVLWPAFAQFLLLGLMFIGGCGGSTGGGLKVIRILILVRSSLGEMRKILHTHGVFHIKLQGRAIKEDVASKVFGFFVLYVVLTIFFAALLTLVSGLDMGTALSASISSIGNIGPGFAAVGPIENFGFINAPGKWILIFEMLIGRLELFTVLIFFSREFWRR
jgi:trk system potassium uptake protein TrkH